MNEIKQRLLGWKVESSEEVGFHPVITKENSECKAIEIYRLNLLAGQKYSLETKSKEMHPVLIEGQAILEDHDELNQEMKDLDSFYLPSNNKITIKALEDSIFYIAAAKCEGIGKPSFRKFDISLPIGDIHQIHGKGVGEREVMFTLDPNTPASHLICGVTRSNVGGWTSWPPHQHEKDLEEAYCYFNMPKPKFGLHLSYLESGDIDNCVAHTVSSGTMVMAPCGYHPTVSSPATRNYYFWALASFSPEQRRYDLAINDPNFE